MAKLGQGSPMEVANNIHKSDVQSYLISRYREALKAGDKSYAKSCLLSTRLFSVDDPNITNEVYVMAKSDGDICEAAKCFSNIFDNLFTNSETLDSLTNEALVVANQMKEEMRLLLNELKNQNLHLRSTPSSASSHARFVPSVSQSPLLSPRLRMSSEDRSISRDSVLRLDKHLASNNKSFFYQQLYDHLKLDVRKNILSYSINNCDNPFERCRLMMLAITLFHDSVSLYAHRLLKTLMDLSQTTNEKTSNEINKTLGTSRPLSMCQYAKSLLVLDAVPLIFELTESRNLEFDIDELFQRTVNFYSESLLERAAEEYEFEELHEGLKKTIAARILAKDMTGLSLDDNIEESLSVTLHLLFERFLLEFSNDAVASESLRQLRQLVADKSTHRTLTFDQMHELISNLELETDIPETILFTCGQEESATSHPATSATPPPKGRGRPKKVQPSVIVSPDDGARKHLQKNAKEALFIFTSILQHMFVNSSAYLKQTRSRVLIRFDNVLASQIESEIIKCGNQRSSRAKNLSNEATGVSPSKRIKIETQPADSCKLPNPSMTEDTDKEVSFELENKDSPLNSEQSRQMDQAILDTLTEVRKCMEFLKSNCPTFSRLFTRFLNSNNSNSLRWFLRVQTDCFVISNNFEAALDLLDRIMISQGDIRVKQEQIDCTEVSTLTVSTGTSPSVEVYHLRAMAQLVSCHIQLLNKKLTYETIATLLAKVKQSGLLTNDESYSTGNLIDEYRAVVSSELGKKTGFLFFDALSLIRYVVSALMDILKSYISQPTPSSDAIVGHTIVLSQIDWPKQAQAYENCISWIRANKPKSTTPQCLSALTKFTYPDFFIYVQDPNVLEDFMSLLNIGITLDIKNPKHVATTTNSQQTNNSTNSRSSTGLTRSGKAITTRGVNKTFKEDLKVALIAQMKNSSPFIPLDLITEFIRSSLVPYLKTLQ